MAMDILDKLVISYLCPVVGKQFPDYNMGLSINYIDITNSL